MADRRGRGRGRGRNRGRAQTYSIDQRHPDSSADSDILPEATPRNPFLDHRGVARPIPIGPKAQTQGGGDKQRGRGRGNHDRPGRSDRAPSVASQRVQEAFASAQQERGRGRGRSGDRARGQTRGRGSASSAPRPEKRPARNPFLDDSDSGDGDDEGGGDRSHPPLTGKNKAHHGQANSKVSNSAPNRLAQQTPLTSKPPRVERVEHISLSTSSAPRSTASTISPADVPPVEPRFFAYDQLLSGAVNTLSQNRGYDIDVDLKFELLDTLKLVVAERLGTSDERQIAGALIEGGILAVVLELTYQSGEVPSPADYLVPFGTHLLPQFQSLDREPQNPGQVEQSGESTVEVPETRPLHGNTHTINSSFPGSKSAGVETSDRAGHRITMSTIDRFLDGVAGIVNSGDGSKLQDWLPIEPPLQDNYNAIIQEMRTQYPATTTGVNTKLETKVQSKLSSVTMADDDPWSGFANFIVQYFCFLRDVDISNLLSTYTQLNELVRKCNSALQTSGVGVVMLPTVVAYSKVLARLALGLDKQPELIAHLLEPTDEGGERLSLSETAANTIRNAFVACLSENAQYPPGHRSGPIGKHTGIYKLANICIKIFFQCGKTKGAEQIFSNIGQKSPPLEIYPRSERVTYLYYLGRFFFFSNHFYRAQEVLGAAYAECHVLAHKQRRSILIHLLTANLILGKFPAQQTLSRPEAQGLSERFLPLCHAVRSGDIASFRRLTDMDNEHAPWFVRHKIFLQIRSRCEILVWRSLCRKVWLLHGNRGEPEARKPPFLELEHFVAAARYLEQQAPSITKSGRATSFTFLPGAAQPVSAYIDSDFDGLADDDEIYDDSGYDEDPFLLPGLIEIESIVSSLISQGLINGYISPGKKLVIQGASKKPAQEAGWPNVWATIKARCERMGGGEIPGWKRSGDRVGGGMVVNMNGARPVGM